MAGIFQQIVLILYLNLNLKNTKALQSIWNTHQYCGATIANPILNDYFLKAWWNVLLLRSSLEGSAWIWRNKLKQIIKNLTNKTIFYTNYYFRIMFPRTLPDSKVHRANMDPTGVPSAPDGPMLPHEPCYQGSSALMSFNQNGPMSNHQS